MHFPFNVYLYIFQTCWFHTISRNFSLLYSWYNKHLSYNLGMFLYYHDFKKRIIFHQRFYHLFSESWTDRLNTFFYIFPLLDALMNVHIYFCAHIYVPSHLPHNEYLKKWKMVLRYRFILVEKFKIVYIQVYIWVCIYYYIYYLG